MLEASALEFGRAAFDVLFAASLKAVALIFVVWLALLLIRPRRPALQHGVWAAVLCGMLLLPVLGLLSLWPQFSSTVVVETAIPVATVSGFSMAEGPNLAASTASSLDWKGLTGLLSLMVTSVFVSRFLLARHQLLRVIARADAVDDPAVQHLAESVLKVTKFARCPRIVSSPEVGTPAVFGYLQQAIILPISWQTWSQEKLSAVLSHELAHVARRDGWIATAASLNASVFWFHPLAWWLRHKLRMSAEMACDDHAVMVDRDPEGYAETLLEIAKSGRDKRALPALIPAMAHTAKVTRRIERILRNSGFQSGMLSWTARRRLTVAALTATVLLSFVSITVGQSDGVGLSGSVLDATGARIPGATVFIIDPARNITEATTTSPAGSYRLDGLLPSATYEIEIRARGFAVGRQTVDLTSDRHMDITLEVGRVQEAIVIAGKRSADDASQPQPPRKRIRIGGNVQPVNLLQHIKPIYPADAEQEGVEGTVLLEAVISKEGEPVGLKATNTVVDQRLVSAAMEAVRLWRYKPALLNGEPVEVVTTMSIVFRLP